MNNWIHDFGLIGIELQWIQNQWEEFDAVINLLGFAFTIGDRFFKRCSREFRLSLTTNFWQSSLKPLIKSYLSCRSNERKIHEWNFEHLRSLRTEMSDFRVLIFRRELSSTDWSCRLLIGSLDFRWIISVFFDEDRCIFNK